MRWLVAGSTGRALLGSRVRPRDLDVEVAAGDAERAAAALGLTLADDPSGGRRTRRARRTLAGVELDCSCDPPGDDPRRFTDAPAVALGALRVRVLPAEEGLRRARASGDPARLAKALRGAPADVTTRWSPGPDQAARAGSTPRETRPPGGGGAGPP